MSKTRWLAGPGLYGLAGISRVPGRALLLKFTGIIFRDDADGTLKHASLADSYVCLGDVRIIEDPEGQFAHVTPSMVAMVQSVEGQGLDRSIDVSGQTLNVTLTRTGLPGESTIISAMLRNPGGLDTIQKIIDVHRKRFE